MPLYRDEGVVLRTTKLGEADRIVTLLTRSHGKIRAVAKGVRRVKSRFGGRLEPFMRVDVLIATGRTLDVVSQAESISAYAAQICAGCIHAWCADGMSPSRRSPGRAAMTGVPGRAACRARCSSPRPPAG